jgi:HEAT repeat protein
MQKPCTNIVVVFMGICCLNEAKAQVPNDPSSGPQAAQVGQSESSGEALVNALASENSQAFEAEVRELVDSLADPRFEVRERSALALLDLGPPALSVLQQLPEAMPREIRQRVSAVKSEIEKRHLVQRSRDFLLDPVSSHSHGLPAWDAFREAVGESRSSKLLYLELIRAQYPLAQQVEALYQLRGSQDDRSALQLELSQQIARRATELYPRIFRGTASGIGDSLALMLAASMLDSETPAPVEVNQLIHATIQLSFFGYLNRPGYRQCLVKLIALWIPKAHDELAPEIMRIAFDLDLPIALPIARRHLAATFDKHNREQAILCIGKFGDATDVPELLKLSKDTTVIHEFTDSSRGFEESMVPPPGLPLNPLPQVPRKLVRINDLATAAAMLLMQQDPRHLFPDFSKEDFLAKFLPDLAIGQESMEARNEAIKAWAREQAARSIES